MPAWPVCAVETLDVFPTLCELGGLPMPDFVHGRSLKKNLEDPQASGRPALSYRGHTTIRDDNFRLILHKQGNAELYDFREGGNLARNMAGDLPEQVERLKKVLAERLESIK